MTPEKEALLELETRRTLYQHIEKNPGVHLRQLERDLGLALSTLEYHLHQMERGGLLSSRADGKVKGYFVATGMDRRDKDILYLVRRKMPRRMLAQLLLEPGLSPGELAARLAISPSTLSSHLRLLERHAAVGVARVGRSKSLTVAEPDRVTRLLVTFRASLVDSLVDRFVATFEGVAPQPTQPPAEGGGGAETAAAEDAPAAAGDEEPGSDARDEKGEDEARRERVRLGALALRAFTALLRLAAGPPTIPPRAPLPLPR